MKKLDLSKNDALALKEFRLRLKRILGKELRKAVLFGSKTKGLDTQGSDIDVLVLIGNSAIAKKTNILDEAFEVNLKYNVYISPRVISLNTYNNPLWRTTPFLQELRKEGIPL